MIEKPILETESEENSDRIDPQLNPVGETSVFDDQQSNASRSKPINLTQHAQDLEEDDFEDEHALQQRQERIYNVSGQRSNFRVTPTEIYGFVAWVITALIVVLFTVWTWIPDSILNGWGLYYLPNKYYAIAIPHWIFATWVVCHFLHDATCLMKSHPRQSYNTLQDKFTKLGQPKQQIGSNQEEHTKTEVPQLKVKINDTKAQVKRERIAEIQDIPITVVNNVLYDKYMGRSYFD